MGLFLLYCVSQANILTAVKLQLQYYRTEKNSLQLVSCDDNDINSGLASVYTDTDTNVSMYTDQRSEMHTLQRRTTCKFVHIEYWLKRVKWKQFMVKNAA